MAITLLARLQLIEMIGAEGGSRTRTPSRTTDFKSVASAIPPPRHGGEDNMPLVTIQSRTIAGNQLKASVLLSFFRVLGRISQIESEIWHFCALGMHGIPVLRRGA
jgi:hypothetical protein